jgi:tetratricopeptide (TPR) repeat protein
MISTQVRKLTLSIDDFDRQLLPASVRGGKPAVRHDAMSDFVRKQFRKLGGRIQKVEYTPSEMQVTWLQDLQAGDPIYPVADMLNRGQRAEGVILLRLLLSDQPDNPFILYNLGMALSDAGKLDEAIDYLDRLRDVDPTHVNGRVALGVALLRHGDDERGIEALEQAVALEPANPWAQRNLGAALTESGRVSSGIEHLREATGLAPDDDQTWYGLGRALELASDDDEADRAYRRVLEINEFGEVASLARQGLTRIAERVLRAHAVDGLRMDAVWYMIDALNAFEGMTPEEVQQVGFECAMLGRRGLDINKSEPKYPLNSLPGEYSALNVVAIMIAAFQQFAPGTDLGIDLAREYVMALSMRQPSAPNQPFPDLLS